MKDKIKDTIIKAIFLLSIVVLLAACSTLSHAADYEEAVSYWEFEDSYDDSFNSAQINADKWWTHSPVGTNIYQTGGKLKIETSGSISGWPMTRISSYGKWAIKGDFDVQVDFSDVSYTSGSSGGGAMYIWSDNFTANSTGIYSRYNYGDGNSKYDAFPRVDGVQVNFNSISTSDSSGTLRVTRSGNTIAGYYKSGESWNLISSYTAPALAQDMYVNLSDDIGNPAGNSISFDNLNIVNGEVMSDTNGSNPGILYGATKISGQHGNALSFNGDSDHVELSDDPNLNFERTDAFTIGGWIKSGTLAVNEIYSRGLTDSTYRGVQLFTSSNYGGTLGFGLYSDVGAGDYMQGYSTTNILDDEWHHVLVTYDGSSSYNGVKMYIDGIENAKQGIKDDLSGTIQINQTPYIGWREDGYGFDGLIDDVGIWDRALSSYEIGSIYNMGIAAYENLALSADNLMLGFDPEELAILAQLYADGKDGLDPDPVVVGDNSWIYLSGDLPGDIGGTTYAIGDSWIYDGKYYIKLGSGLEGGAVPEMPPFAVQGMVLAFGSVSIWVRRRRVKVSADNAMLL